MILRSAITTFAALLLSGAAWAAPVLKSDIVVTAPIVTIGDMFDAAGPIAEQPLFRAPNPGTSGMVSVTDIVAALARIGIEEFETGGLDGVRVSRAAAVIDEAVLTDLITADLSARGIISKGMTVDTLFSVPVKPLNAEAVAEPASVISLRYLPGSGAFTARFAIAGIEQPLDVSGSIELMIAAPHINASLPAGTLLSADNIEMRPVPLKFVESTGVARLEDVVGKSLVRQSREGMMLKATDVSVPLLISKNDAVTIYFRNGPMTLTVKGQAVTGAAAGGLVQVINLMSKRVISATAISAGAVEVSADPLALAGL
ncbi:flagellar basal body P-ring formation chaperone FlgA [Devosia sp.]|uniref:flagellar basal body P-ring formation chaperone FlgA n=1 Tax=Devosia sp. TaxID=1871048 RepID=UPI0019FA1B82|nr:flagellar basal body P-ring formation chaperone FlgA [Devosia sp.]MBE0578392.1 flagellar basal body P-ring formation protein FlgA [Devosia sp.]